MISRHSSKFFTLWLLALAISISAQVQSGGSAAAGMGQVYEASGRSAASRDLQRKMSTALLRAVAKETATAGRRTSEASRRRTARPSSPVPMQAPQTPENTATFFRPDPDSNYMSVLADQLGSNDLERSQLKMLFTATKQAFEKEVAAKGRSNNIAAAFTLFIASTVTVYHDDPEPSDEAVDKLWDGMSSALEEMPEVANLTNTEKQQMYDMLIAFSGFVLAGHLEGKNSGDADTQKIFKALSGVLIQTVLKTDPAKLRFNRNGLDIVS